jgi:hypothetical protein
VYVVELQARGREHAHLGGARPDLFLGEAVELLARLPDIGHADAPVGLGDAVEQGAGRSGATGAEAHLLEHLVVLIEAGPLEVLVSPRGSERDRGQVLASVEVGRQLLRDQHFEVVDHVADGDRVASRVVWTGTLAVEAPPFAAGSQLRADSSMHFMLRDGCIARQENFDCFQAPADP